MRVITVVKHKDTVSVSFRYSERMHQALLQFTSTVCMSSQKEDAVQVIVDMYLRNPTIYDAMNVIELREPMSRNMTVSLHKDSVTALRGIANEAGIPLSTVIRYAMYQCL